MALSTNQFGLVLEKKSTFELTFKDPFSFLKKFLMELQYSYIGLFWMFIFIAETYNFVTLFYYHVSNKRIAECVPRVNEKLFEYSLPAFWVCSSKSIIILHVWLTCMTTSLPCNCWAKLFLKAASFILCMNLHIKPAPSQYVLTYWNDNMNYLVWLLIGIFNWFECWKTSYFWNQFYWYIVL